MPSSRSPALRSIWPLRSLLLRYSVAVLSVLVSALLIQGLTSLSDWDLRPGFLVAIAVSSLYGGKGPGFLSVVLAGVVAMDPGVFLGGAALAAVCSLFRRSPAGELATPSSPEEPATDLPSANFEGSAGRSIAFSSETPHLPPPFIELTTEATWRFHHEKPLDITLPEDEQVEHLYLYSMLAECNDAFARMYGFRTAGDVIGTRLVVFCPPSNPENLAYLRSFIRSGYRLEDAESQEIDRYGNTKYFVNNLVGIFERGQLVGAWGTQRDVTEQKRSLQSQEYRSRIHSAKSSSQ
ncbi:MAG TPA: PAS domain-containing protein [Gemmatimonadales bacterium]|nr:PAS domain-containing protein [Gemmatimonadales bacterium]